MRRRPCCARRIGSRGSNRLVGTLQALSNVLESAPVRTSVSAPRYTEFRRFSHHTAIVVGSPAAFGAALATVAIWAILGPIFHYSDTWQLTINTGTTIITFLMVFVIQNTQNRDAQAMQLKLDELIRAVEQARNELVDLEDLSDEELHRLQLQFEGLRKAAETARATREPSTVAI
jgi:low affinity Fe/Cu permease